MEIILLHYAAPPVVGGVESVLGHQARQMANHGHQVSVVAGRGAQFDERVRFVHLPRVDSRHPEVLRVKQSLDQGEVPEAFTDLEKKISKALKEAIWGADFLIAHNVCSLNKNLALTAALYRLYQENGSPKLVLWHHDLAWKTPRYRGELHEGYPWDLLRSDWPGAFQVTVSQTRRQELCELLSAPKERILVVPNGLDFHKFFKLEERTLDFIEKLDLLSASPLFLLPVRVTPRKNIELAMRILAELRVDRPNAALVVTGPLGPHNPANARYYETLLALRTELGLESWVHFLAEHTQEYLPDEVIADFYRLADALLMPSREEGFGIPILEAGASGLAIYCADIPQLRELGGDQVVYFSPDAEPQQAARLLARHLEMDHVLAMRSRVRSAYTWEQIYREHIAPLLEI